MLEKKNLQLIKESLTTKQNKILKFYKKITIKSKNKLKLDLKYLQKKEFLVGKFSTFQEDKQLKRI